MAWRELDNAWVGMAVTGENDMLQKLYRDHKDIWASRCTTDGDLTSMSQVINVFKTAANRAGVPGPE